jgi:hypothetical protein
MRLTVRAPARPVLFDWAVDRDELDATDPSGPPWFDWPSPGSRHVRLLPAEEAVRARLRPPPAPEA